MSKKSTGHELKHVSTHSNKSQKKTKAAAGKIFFIFLIVIFGALYLFVINKGKKLRSESSVLIEKMAKERALNKN